MTPTPKTPGKARKGATTKKATKFKGALNIRMAPAMHYQLKRKADAEGISLNQLCVVLLAGGIGFKLVEPEGEQ